MAIDRRCSICGTRPVEKDRDTGHCKVCQGKLDRDKRLKSHQDNAWKDTAFCFVHWKGIIVAYYPNGGESLRPTRIFKTLKAIPKGKLLNLDTYLKGFTREQVKKMKASVRKLSYGDIV